MNLSPDGGFNVTVAVFAVGCEAVENLGDQITNGLENNLAKLRKRAAKQERSGKQVDEKDQPVDPENQCNRTGK